MSAAWLSWFLFFTRLTFLRCSCTQKKINNFVRINNENELMLNLSSKFDFFNVASLI